jgi:hypothetical protein
MLEPVAEDTATPYPSDVAAVRKILPDGTAGVKT